MLTHLSLFSGIGGIDLASERAGFTTVGQCEMAEYPYKVLCKHWPNVPKWRDVRDVTADSVRGAGIGSITLVSAGYPCQTFSVAGKREGDLTLAKQFIRVVDELRPKWALGENVGGHITNGLDDVIWMFRDKGYAARPYVLRARDVGAPHERRRVFVMAHANIQRQQECDIPTFAKGTRQYCRTSHADVAHASCEPDAQTNKVTGSKRERWEPWDDVGWSYWRCMPEPNWTVSESELDRMADGVSNGLDALGCLGNAVVPYQVYPILKAIADVERRDA